MKEQESSEHYSVISTGMSYCDDDVNDDALLDEKYKIINDGNLYVNCNDEDTSNDSSDAKKSDSEQAILKNTSKTEQMSKPIISILAACVLNEFRLQNKLSKVPQAFYQNTVVNEKIISLLSTFLMRKMTPSLIFGTHPILNSWSGYAKTGPTSKHNNNLRIREVLTMTSDGAEVALDWEFPIPSNQVNRIQRDIVHGPHKAPLVVLLHGINNDAEFGYIRCMMESCTRRGWIAVGMNMRGCGSGMKLSTPRGYNGAYTGDIRSVVNILSHRMSDESNAFIFLAGYSLGANLVVKYLGEEGLSNTLPHKVKGGLSLGNPLRINSGNLKFPWNVLLGAGIKRGVLIKHYKTLREMRCDTHQRQFFGALMAPTLGELDHRVSPVLIRNETIYPFSTKIGFEDGHDYWNQASSCNYIQHVSVPLLVLMSKDDFLIRHVAKEYIPHSIQSNPNVIFIESETGGHLGWNVTMGNNPFGNNPFGSTPSWCDELSSRFIEALLWMEEHKQNKRGNETDLSHTHGKGVTIEKFPQSRL